MKILVSKEEIQRIVRAELIRRELPLKQIPKDEGEMDYTQGAVHTHVEGQYDDAIEVFDGLEFELKD